MPEVGGKRLADEFAGLLAKVRQAVDDIKLEVAGAVTELMTEVNTGKQVARSLREEANAVRQAFGGILGNAPAEDPPTKPDGGGGQ